MSSIEAVRLTDYPTGIRYTAYLCEQNHPHYCRHDAACCNRHATRRDTEGATQEGTR